MRGEQPSHARLILAGKGPSPRARGADSVTCGFIQDGSPYMQLLENWTQNTNPPNREFSTQTPPPNHPRVHGEQRHIRNRQPDPVGSTRHKPGTKPHRPTSILVTENPHSDGSRRFLNTGFGCRIPTLANGSSQSTPAHHVPMPEFPPTHSRDTSPSSGHIGKLSLRRSPHHGHQGLPTAIQGRRRRALPLSPRGHHHRGRPRPRSQPSDPAHLDPDRRQPQGPGAATPEEPGLEQENRQLRARIAELEEAWAFLRKATACFAGEIE
ncbi:hypothetical protein HNR23_001383 [Nocardiopsis mwathae]|uniref:Uncharacterized protein n=1 Tax=Nocardiopsis mwathae TaxID=1472723 RepID=A0A7W9YFP7_9ACTN|nr:hypothetical protein [Nocardiopsis mwathae]